MANLASSENLFVEALGNLGTELGLNRAVAQIYALLYLREAELSLDDIAEALVVSKATVSTNMRDLERWGAARRTWVEGSRKDWFVANRDTLGVVLAALRDGLRRRLDRLEDALARMTVEAGEEDDLVMQRVAEVRKMVEMGRAALAVLDRPDARRLAGLLPLLRKLGRSGRQEGGGDA